MTNADTIYMRRALVPVGSPTPYMLAPCDGRAAEALAKVPPGAAVAVVIKRGRSVAQHRLFWAVLAHVAEATKWETPERLLVALKIRLGRYDLMQLPSGKVVPVPESISFAAMGQDGFQRFMDDAIRVLCEEVLSGANAAELIAEVQALIGADTKELHEAAA